MGKKIFGIYLAKLDAPNSEAHARLELPASPLELHDAMDKVQLQENEELYLEIDDYYGFEYLAPHLMELDASLNELNDLAGRLAVLDETEQEAFDGLLRLEIQRKVESNGSILTMQDLRTLAVSAGADCCHVVGATSDAELGRFYAENGFMEELDGLSDDVFEMLDFGKIGKALRTGETGTFTRNGYVVQHSELVTAPPCAKELPEKPEYLFRLTLGLHPDLEDDRTVTLELPASAEALREVQKQLGADGWEGAMVLDYDGIIPQAAEFADLPMELDAFNDFAEAVEAMAQQEEIVLWIDRRWKNAIEKHLKGETLQEHLENVLDELCNQLPEREYDRISRAIQSEAAAQRAEEEAARTYAAYHVTERGQEWYFKTSPGEELLAVGKKLRGYLTQGNGVAPDKFIGMFFGGQPITAKEFDALTALRMENTGKVRGVFDVNFDKCEFSAVHIMDGWQTWAMRDVSVAVYHATRSQFASGDDKWRKLLDHLKGKEITSAGHLSAQNFSFGEEIIELDGKLNFYLQADFDVDAAFGTFVCTDQNDDWLNIYANYDVEQDRLCNTLDLNLCKGDGSEEDWSYPLNAAEQEVLLCKMEAFCQQQTGMSLHEYARQLRDSETQAPEMQM